MFLFFSYQKAYSASNVAVGINKNNSLWIKEHIHSLGVQYKRIEQKIQNVSRSDPRRRVKVQTVGAFQTNLYKKSIR